MTPYQFTLWLHQRVYEYSRGWLGHRLIVAPTLLLATRGRRTGRERVNALVYAKVHGEYAVVASKGGSDSAPGWLFNLRAEPKVTVQIGRRRFPATARIVPPDQEGYDALIGRCDEVARGAYTRYRRMTDRPIPVVVLTPARQ